MEINTKELNIQIKSVKLRTSHVSQMLFSSPQDLMSSKGLGYIIKKNQKYGIITDGGDYYKIIIGSTSFLSGDNPKRIFCSGCELFRKHIFTVEEAKNIKNEYDRLINECLLHHIYL